MSGMESGMRVFDYLSQGSFDCSPILKLLCKSFMDLFRPLNVSRTFTGPYTATWGPVDHVTDK